MDKRKNKRESEVTDGDLGRGAEYHQRTCFTYTERRTLRECASSSSGMTCTCHHSGGLLHSARPPTMVLGVGVVGAPWDCKHTYIAQVNPGR